MRLPIRCCRRPISVTRLVRIVLRPDDVHAIGATGCARRFATGERRDRRPSDPISISVSPCATECQNTGVRATAWDDLGLRISEYSLLCTQHSTKGSHPELYDLDIKSASRRERIKVPHGDARFAVFQVENEVLSARLLHIGDKELKQGSRRMSNDWKNGQMKTTADFAKDEDKNQNGSKIHTTRPDSRFFS